MGNATGTATAQAVTHPSWCERQSPSCGTIETATLPDGSTETVDRLHMRTILRMVVDDTDLLGAQIEIHVWIERLDTEDEGQRTRVVMDSRRHNPRTLSVAEVDDVVLNWDYRAKKKIVVNAVAGNSVGCIASFTAEQAARLAHAYAYAAELLAEAETATQGSR